MPTPSDPHDLSDFELRTLPGLWNLYDTTPRQLAFNAATQSEAEAWQQTLRAKVTQLLGGFPADRCVLDPHTLRVTEAEAFTVELIVIQTLPGEYMPVYVLIPHQPTLPLRPLIAVHGHGTGGARLVIGAPGSPVEVEVMRALNYDYARQLAERGYMVFAPVLRAMGERMEDEALSDRNDPAWYASCYAAGLTAMLCGKTLLGLRIWDIMRLVDYISMRPEPISARVGCVGLSGGGTVTLFSAALEPRIDCAVVSGYVNTFRDSIMAIRHCGCNYIPGIVQYAEISDIAGLIAPRPLFVESGKRDPIFPIAGANRAYSDLQAIYACFGAEDRLGRAIFEGEHAWNGAQAYPWLERWL